MKVDIDNTEIYLITATPNENFKSGVRISWHTSHIGSSLLYKEVNSDSYFEIFPDEKAWFLKEAYEVDQYQDQRYVCNVDLSNLEINKKYQYKVICNDIESTIHYFDVNDKLPVLAFADLQYSKNIKSLTLIKNFIRQNPDTSLIICSGDIADEGSSESSHRFIIDSEIFNNVIFASAVGDHEYWGRSTPPYIQFPKPHTYNAIFNNPKNGPSNLLNRTYYFKYNNILFLFLDCGDSNIKYNNPIFYEQAIWLDKILQSENSCDYTIVCMHKSLYGAIEQDIIIEKIKPIFTKIFDYHHVDLVISGHDHQYSRTLPLKNNNVNFNGTIYLDLGSSGTKVRSTAISVSSKKYYAKYLDLKKLEYALGAKIIISNNGLEIEIRNQNYEIVDNISILKKDCGDQMNGNLLKAKDILKSNEYTCVLCKDDIILYSTLRGVKPLVDFSMKQMNYAGFSAADRVIGKATAYLYVKLHVVAVYTHIISKPALEIFLKHNIYVEYDELVENIINRQKNGLCPFEEEVLNVDDCEIAYQLILQKLKSFNKE